MYLCAHLWNQLSISSKRIITVNRKERQQLRRLLAQESRNPTRSQSSRSNILFEATEMDLLPKMPNPYALFIQKPYISTMFVVYLWITHIRLRRCSLWVRVSIFSYGLILLQPRASLLDLPVAWKILLDVPTASPPLFLIISDLRGFQNQNLLGYHSDSLPPKTSSKKMGKRAISRILQKTTSPHDDICAICRGDFRSPVKLPCGHIYCEECIRLSLGDRNICPYCKQEYA